MHRKTNAADSRSGFVIASDVVMHHTKVDGKRIVQPLWCQSVFLGNCCGNLLYREHLFTCRFRDAQSEKYLGDNN